MLFRSRKAAAVHPIVDLQIEYALVSRGPEDDILATTRELGIAITAYGVLSRGLISGHATTDISAPSDFRSHSPRFQGENLAKNLALTETLRAEAAKLALSPAQAAIAWALAKGDDIVPVIGARTRERLAETLGALEKPLTPDAVAALEAAMPRDAVAGERYPAMQMAMLDSERRGA